MKCDVQINLIGILVRGIYHDYPEDIKSPADKYEVTGRVVGQTGSGVCQVLCEDNIIRPLSFCNLEVLEPDKIDFSDAVYDLPKPVMRLLALSLEKMKKENLEAIEKELKH